MKRKVLLRFTFNYCSTAVSLKITGAFNGKAESKQTASGVVLCYVLSLVIQPTLREDAAATTVPSYSPIKRIGDMAVSFGME